MAANPEDPRNRLSLAIALCAWDDSAEPIELLQPWQEPPQGLRTVTPAIRALGLYTLGYALEQDGRPDEAEKAYRQAQDLAEEAGAAETAGVAEQAELAGQRLAPILAELKKEDHRKALSQANQLCREGWRRRQDALHDWRAFNKARLELKNARVLQERERLQAQEPLRSFYSAIRCFSGATQAYPTHARAYRQHGFCYLTLMERRAALPQLKAAALYDPYSPSGLAALGEIQLAQGDFSDAQQTFERLLHVEPEYGPAHLGLAKALFHQIRTERQVDRVLQCLERAKSLGADIRSVMRLEIDANRLQERLRKGELFAKSPHTDKPRTAPEGDIWKGSVLDH
jgi:Flp pilus assembly protein TadD